MRLSEYASTQRTYGSRKVPRSVQQSIPIDRIYEDGTWCCGNVYSQMWSMPDINFTMSDEDNKAKILNLLGKVYMGVPSDCWLKICMIEIYLLTSLAPIPFATVPNRETGHMGQNYFRSLFAVGFQGLLILVCVAIYAVLIQSIATDGDPIGAIWGCVGYTVLLCFTLFKTGSLAKSIFGCH